MINFVRKTAREKTMRLDMYAQGEARQAEPSVWEWLQKDQIKNENLYRNLECQDELIRELMARQDRQGKWIAFLLLDRKSVV